VYKLNQHSKDGETIIVPGKVLGVGELDHKVNVAALSFSTEAEEKIGANGTCMSIEELMKKDPKGSKVRILG
jgi:large subunit ribosomal protein L18e